MAWRIVEISESDASPKDLTDAELIGIRVSLMANMGAPNESNVYFRACEKLAEDCRKALRNVNP